jgi:membrane-associated protein
VEFLKEIVDVVLHLDRHLNQWAADLGPWTYVLLFAIVFCETGLVITPFLPGDSLLFAVGALSATEGSPIDPVWVGILLFVAAVLGDAVNYAIGKRIGPRVFTEGSRFFKREHLDRTHAFYEKYGGKTIVLARFVPIVRTFAPFVAGVAQMGYRKFAVYNVLGAFVWVTLFVWAGWQFGQAEIVQRNFHYVILAIIVISILPGVWEWWRVRRATRAQG